jgi:hypothetical protein
MLWIEDYIIGILRYIVPVERLLFLSRGLSIKDACQDHPEKRPGGSFAPKPL